MNKSFSVYLDVVRFGSAALVLYYHASSPKFLPWLPWVDLGHDAVITFFVLSGFVIAHSRTTKDKTLRDYALARISRVYAVHLPILILSVALFFVGAGLNPAIYDGQRPGMAAAVLAFASNLLLFNQNWFLSVSTFSNAPIWSLCYEAWYYVFFAAIAFVDGGARRAVLLCLLFALAGPRVLIMFPVWLLGYRLYGVINRREIGIARSGVYSLAPIAIILALYAIGARRAVNDYMASVVGESLSQLGWSHQFLFDYLVGVLVALQFIGAYGILRLYPDVLARFAPAARRLAALTFPLYLVHFPLLHFFAAVLTHDPENKLRGILLIGIVLLCAMLVTALSEKLRGVLRSWVARYWRRDASLVVAN